MKNNFQSKLKKNKSSRFKKTKLKKRLQKGGTVENEIVESGIVENYIEYFNSPKIENEIEKEINFDTLINEFEELRYGNSFDSKCRDTTTEISKLFKKPEDCDRFHLELAKNVHIKKTIFGVSQGNDKIAKELLASLEENCEKKTEIEIDEKKIRQKQDFLRKAFKIDKDNIKPEPLLNLFYTEKENKKQEEQEEQEQSIENKTIEKFILENIESIIFNVFKVNTDIKNDKCDLSNKIFILLRVLSVILSNKIELDNVLPIKLFNLLQNKIESNIEQYLNSSQNGGDRDDPQSYYQRTKLFNQNVNSISKIGKHKKICKHIFIGILKSVLGFGAAIGLVLGVIASKGTGLLVFSALVSTLGLNTILILLVKADPLKNFKKTLSDHIYSNFFKSILENNDFKILLKKLEKKLTLNSNLPDETSKNNLPDEILNNVDLLVKNFTTSILNINKSLLDSLIKDKKENIKVKLINYIYSEYLNYAQTSNFYFYYKEIIFVETRVNEYLRDFDNIKQLDINISHQPKNFTFEIKDEDDFNDLMYKIGMYSFQEKGKASEIIKYEIYLSEIGEFIIYICKNKKIPREVKEYILKNFKTLFSKLIRNTQETFNEVVFVNPNTEIVFNQSSQTASQSTQKASQSSQKASQSSQKANPGIQNQPIEVLPTA
jgi:hypothetical protein